MGTVKRLAVIILFVITFFITAYVSMRVVASIQQGYSWSEMDWEQKGTTSLGDFFAASDIGKRETTRAGKKCIEYFAYKDGLPVKTVCPSKEK